MDSPTTLPIVLGSSSSSRRKIMELLEWPFEVMVPDIDEKAIRCDDHLELPLLIARAKAAALWSRLVTATASAPAGEKGEPFVLITSDQIVYFNGEVREKPINEEEACTFLASYSKSAVQTVSATVATHWPSGRQASDVDVATVLWREIPDDVVRRVVARGEIFASAGGFRVEDPDLNPLILDIEGGVDSVMGLPVDSLVKVIDGVLDDPERRDSVDLFGRMSLTSSLRTSGHSPGNSNNNSSRLSITNSMHGFGAGVGEGVGVGAPAAMGAGVTRFSVKNSGSGGAATGTRS